MKIRKNWSNFLFQWNSFAKSPAILFYYLFIVRIGVRVRVNNRVSWYVEHLKHFMWYFALINNHINYIWNDLKDRAQHEILIITECAISYHISYRFRRNSIESHQEASNYLARGERTFNEVSRLFIFYVFFTTSHLIWWWWWSINIIHRLRITH